MERGNKKRPISIHTTTQRLYTDDHQTVMSICRDTGQKPAVALRDLVSEALRARRIRERRGIIEGVRQKTAGEPAPPVSWMDDDALRRPADFSLPLVLPWESFPGEMPGLPDEIQPLHSRNEQHSSTNAVDRSEISPNLQQLLDRNSKQNRIIRLLLDALSLSMSDDPPSLARPSETDPPFLGRI